MWGSNVYCLIRIENWLLRLHGLCMRCIRFKCFYSSLQNCLTLHCCICLSYFNIWPIFVPLFFPDNNFFNNLLFWGAWLTAIHLFLLVLKLFNLRLWNLALDDIRSRYYHIFLLYLWFRLMVPLHRWLPLNYYSMHFRWCISSIGILSFNNLFDDFLLDNFFLGCHFLSDFLNSIERIFSFLVTREHIGRVAGMVGHLLLLVCRIFVIIWRRCAV